jgi:hypothetical protein
MRATLILLAMLASLGLVFTQEGKAATIIYTANSLGEYEPCPT